MLIEPGPHDLDAVRFILGPDSNGRNKAVGPEFYAELVTEYPDFTGHVLIQSFTFEDPWPTWEVHPCGDEWVYLLEGDTDFILRQEGKEHTVRVDRPGTCAVVPRGAFHTARPHARTTMLFVTPGEGTLNAESPPAD